MVLKSVEKEKIVVIGGPCSVEGKDMICHLAQEVKNSGGVMLRGGAYKQELVHTLSRVWGTRRYSGNGGSSLKKTGLPIVTELMSADKLDEFIEYVDVIQIGARNMQNFDLLKAVGKNQQTSSFKTRTCQYN